jgi:hypothetical protein
MSLMMTRRGFLKTCLSLAVAPAIVKAGNIMRINPGYIIGDFHAASYV